MTEFPIRIPQQLGAILRGFRREMKLTQKDVGDKTGMPQNAISQLETNPGPASFARIANLEIVIRRRDTTKETVEW
jgi:transcriptional regulator with XRE-family HTH domain